MGASRELAVDLLGRLLGGGRGLPRAGAAGRGGEADRDERLAAEIAHGAVRTLAHLDRAIAHATGKPVASVDPAVLPLLRVGAYQLLYLPSVPRYAAVSETVAVARRRTPKAAGFVNWTLRRITPDGAAPPPRAGYPDEVSWLAAVHSFPPWIVGRWVARLGAEETGRLLSALNEHPPAHLRVNRLRATVAEAASGLAAAGMATEPGRHAPFALRLAGPGSVSASAPFAAGLVYLQDESSQLAAEVLRPRPGERVLDACAGLGGKATQLAEISGGRSRILALDRDAARLRRLAENAGRLGDPGIEARAADLLERGALAGERFDAVLLDAPCSGLGTLARHPELRWTKRPGDPARLAAVQRSLLDRAATFLGPGGRLVYSTCSTEPEEGEEVVGAFLGEHPAFAAEAPAEGALIDAPALASEGFLRSWPHRHGMGGAFVALLRRR